MFKEVKRFVKENKYWIAGCVAAGVALGFVVNRKVSVPTEIHAIANQAEGTVDLLTGTAKSHGVLYVLSPNEAQGLATEISNAVQDISDSMLL